MVQKTVAPQFGFSLSAEAPNLCIPCIPWLKILLTTECTEFTERRVWVFTQRGSAQSVSFPVRFGNHSSNASLDSFIKRAGA